METNPSLHSFEYEDVCLLRIMNCSLPLAFSDLCIEAKAELADTRKRVVRLTSIGLVELVGYDVNLHTAVYAITEGGKKLLACIDRLRGTAVEDRARHLLGTSVTEPATKLWQKVRDLSKVQPYAAATVRTPKSSKACLYCGADSNRGMNGMAWCSKSCFTKDVMRLDCAFLWACGIRADDDLIDIAGRIHESEKQNSTS